MKKSWPVIEYDNNNPKPRDIVTTNQAEDIEVGDIIIAVAMDHERRDFKGVEMRYLDWGFATLARVTKKWQLYDDDDLWFIVAEFVDSAPSESIEVETRS